MGKKILVLALLTLGLLLTLLLWDINPDILLFALKKRSVKVMAILITGTSLSIGTLIFQTVTNNRILSPSILGLDSLYILFQMLVALLIKPVATDTWLNFIVSSLLMITFSLMIYIKILSSQRSIFTVILVGVIMGTLFTSISGMIQISIDPDEFNSILDKLFASYNSVNESLLLLSGVILGATTIPLLLKHRSLDVLSLGKDQALNLGINYIGEIKFHLVSVFILVSISTALVGPISFLGFLSANIARNFLKKYRHKYLIPVTALISCSTLFIGQILVERLFSFTLPIGVLISVIGGSYFILLLFKEAKK